MERAQLTIDGMSCGHCVNAVRQVLAALPGVEVEQVAIGSATVTYDPARTSPGALADAIADEGYAAHAAER